MNKEDFLKVQNYFCNVVNTISTSSLINNSDRTLLYGYNSDGSDVHLYIEDNMFYLVKYFNKDVVENVVISCTMNIEDIIPSKRLYPERCDREFCILLKDKGISLDFTVFNDKIKKEQFYGRTS